MRLQLDEDQELIRRSVRKLLDGFPVEQRRTTWGKDWPRGAYSQLAESGLLELALGPHLLGQPMAAAIVLGIELGRASLISPLVTSVAACGCLLNQLGDAQHSALLASGTSIAALAVEENQFVTGALEPGLEFCKGRLRGVKRSVSFADDADFLLVAARDANGTIVLLRINTDHSGVTMRKLDSISGEPLFDVEFDLPVTRDSICGSGETVEQAMRRTLTNVFAMQSAILVGGGERALEIASNHVVQREQFGQPLGAFQAVKHHIANSRLALDAARLMVFELAWKIDRGETAILAHAAETKLWTATATAELLRRAHELQGGISVVDMHETMLLYRRNLADSLLWGSPPELLPLTYPLRSILPTVQPVTDI